MKKSFFLSFACGVWIVLTGILTSCALGPRKVIQLSIAEVENLHGYNEPSNTYLNNGKVGVRTISWQGSQAYLISFYDAWFLIAGDPGSNRFWFQSDDPTVKLLLIRRSNFEQEYTFDDIVELAQNEKFEGMEVIPFEGHASVEAHRSHFEIFMDVRSVAIVPRNQAWLKMLDKTGRNLDAARFRSIPGDLKNARIVGSITAITLFTKW